MAVLFFSKRRDTRFEKTPKQLSDQQTVALESFYTTATTLNNIVPKP